MSAQVFTEADTYLRPDLESFTEDIKKKLLRHPKVAAAAPRPLLGTHWGQRKLALALLEFVLFFWDSKKHPSPKFVYVGAAEGTNIGLISRLFPAINWYLYDMRRFRISTTEKITIYEGDEEGKFTDEIAQHWQSIQEKDGDVYFISDIRNVAADHSDYLIRSKFIYQDMEMQREWCRIIQPVYAQLKFPFIAEEKRGVAISERYLNYMNGIVFFQAWNRENSYETRLVVSDSNSSYDWDLRAERSRITFINKVLRTIADFKVDLGGGVTMGKANLPTGEPSALDGSWDAAYEVYLWKRYLERHSEQPTEAKIMQLSAFLTKIISNGRHSLASKQSAYLV